MEKTEREIILGETAVKKEKKNYMEKQQTLIPKPEKKPAEILMWGIVIGLVLGFLIFAVMSLNKRPFNPMAKKEVFIL